MTTYRSALFTALAAALAFARPMAAQAADEPSTPERRSEALAVHDAVAQALATQLRAGAMPLPALLQELPRWIVAIAANEADRVARVPGAPATQRDGRGHFRPGCGLFKVDTGDGRASVQLMTSSFNLPHYEPTADGTAMASMWLKVTRRSEAGAQHYLAHASDNAAPEAPTTPLEVRFEVMSRYRNRQGSYGETPWSAGVGLFEFVATRVGTDGRKKWLAVSARPHAAGSWVVQTLGTTARPTAESAADDAVSVERYELFLKDGTRRRLSLEEGRRRWDFETKVQVSEEGPVWNRDSLEALGIQVVFPVKGGARRPYLRRGKGFKAEVAARGGRDFAEMEYPINAGQTFADGVTWKAGRRRGAAYRPAELAGGRKATP
ncbi:MAG: hypothetical protein IT371_30955 [Deltaproteobacteria bacterium]|nr:hypothetical protein [Deltaproteobacteria bacterium]